ncbi:MAG: helix-turn-helix domain-containing protein [Promethearchaeia archaeon]
MEKIVEKANNLLKQLNYHTFTFIGEQSKFCFDLLVKKGNYILMLKVFSNIDNIDKEEIENIKSLSILLKSKPVLIGIRNRYQKLDDSTIYVRYGLPFITYTTFKRILTKNQYPHILARRGGGVIYLDGDLMKNIRSEKRISRKELSEELGVAKRTVFSYENEKMRPSKEIANKILNILEESSIFRRINVFEWHMKFDLSQEIFHKKQELSEFKAHLQNIINDIGISSLWYEQGNAPFEVTMYSSDYISKGEDNKSGKRKRNFYPLFSGVSDDAQRVKDINIEALNMFTRLFNKKGIFIVDNDFKLPDNYLKKLPFIKIKQLDKIDTEEEFIDFIKKK